MTSDEENLLYAAHFQHGNGGALNTIEGALADGANVNARDEEGRTALYWAGGMGTMNVVDILLSAGADVGAKDNNGNEPLHEAASVEVANALINHGADVNAQNLSGQTPLHSQIDGRNAAVVSTLLAAGADLSIVNKKGERPDERTASLPKEAASAIDKAFLDHAARRQEAPEHDARKPRVM